MKWLTVLTISLFSIFNLSAQNGIGLSVGALYSEQYGLNLEVSIDKQIFSRTKIIARASTNNKNVYGFNAGFNYNLLSHKKFNLTIGAEYAYNFYDNSEHGGIKGQFSEVEFPILLNYNITDRIHAFGGITSSIGLDQKNINIENKLIHNTRFGIGYRF